MDTGATGSGRFGPLGSASPTARVARRQSGVSPGKAVTRSGSGTDNEDQSPDRGDEGERHPPPEERYTLAAETRLVLLTSNSSGAFPPRSPDSRPARVYRGLDTDSDGEANATPAPHFQRTV